jgi:hypothetical protein
MDVVVARVAGLDVHKDTVMAAVRVPGANGKRTELLEPQRIGERVGDQRFRQSMSFAVRSRATARAN